MASWCRNMWEFSRTHVLFTRYFFLCAFFAEYNWVYSRAKTENNINIHRCSSLKATTEHSILSWHIKLYELFNDLAEQRKLYPYNMKQQDALLSVNLFQ